MKKYLLIIVTILFFVNSITCFAQNRKEQFEITSQEVKGETYSIEVLLPDDYDSTKKYPIIYFPDWWYGTRLIAALYELLNFAQTIESVIIVGIESKSSVSVKDWTLNRGRDLTPTNVTEQDLLSGVPAGTSGGAKHYLSFIKNELIPTVEKKYASDPEKRGYFGFSFGGLFGTYILLNEPQLFKKYFIGSPSLWWDDYLLSKELEKMKSENLASVKSVFIAVEEDGKQLKGFTDIRERLLKIKPSNLQLESAIIYGEDHLTAVPSAIIKGLKYLYGK